MNSLLLIGVITMSGSKFKGGESQTMNGLEVQPGQSNHHVTILRNYIIGCSGGIVEKNHVITAAHCVEKFKREELIIVAGAVSARDPQIQHRRVKLIILPQVYNITGGLLYDVAVLRLLDPLVLGGNIAVITFSTATESGYDMTTCSLTGVENTDSEMPRAREARLSEIELLLVPNEVCGCMLEVEIPRSLSCATGIKEAEVTPVRNY